MTIVCDACPYLKQNKEYAEYLLTAAYHESLKREPWEEDKFDETDRFDYKGGTITKQAQMEVRNYSIIVLS